MYAIFFKRLFDFLIALVVLVVLSPLYLVLAILVRVKLGKPVFFTQVRPGLVDKSGKERLFKLYKFRTMTDEKNQEGKLLPDDVRLTKFGATLRDTSLDELPEFFNILKGDMSLIGPRPLLVRDMTFMSVEQRKRHTVRPGLSGLAQVNGRNAIEWEDKLNWDLKYIQKINLWEDLRIILVTIIKVFKRESITYEGMVTAEDYGDYLLRVGKTSPIEYNQKQKAALELLRYNQRNV